MISEVVMPQMGADMTEGTIVRWLKHEGDTITRGEIIAEIETDKANVEIEAFEGGVFRATLASEGDVVPVGGVIAVVGSAEDDISTYTNGAGATKAGSSQAAADIAEPTRLRERAPSGQPEAQGQSAVVAALTPLPQRAAQPPASNGGRRIHVSPVARTLAEEHGVDLRLVRGTGPDGRIIRRDVEQMIATGRTTALGAAPAPSTTAPTAAVQGGPEQIHPSKMRQAIARRMSQSKREAPHYYLLLDVDMTEARSFREQVNHALAQDQRVSINDIIVRAVALALRKHPRFNATMAGDDATTWPAQNVCIGIALDEGLIAPAILDAGRKSLAVIADEAKDLVARAKSGKLHPDELNDGTFTISNLGAYGVGTLVAIIQPPQTAILGVGAMSERAVVRGGTVVVREMMSVALSADHRVTDGAEGAKFIAEIQRLLEQPLLLVL